MPNQYTFSDDDDHLVRNQAPTYEFKDAKPIKTSLKDRLNLRGSKKSRRTGSIGSNKSTSSRSSTGTNNNDDDGTGSLTYSATSSVASESSFHSNIVKLLQQEGRDSKEIAALLNNHRSHHSSGTNYDEKSCAADSLAFSARSNASDSLAYSVEAESYMRMLAADGESTAHISQVSLLQGTALLSNGQSESSSQNAYSGLTTSYVNNGGGQRLDITDEGKVMMMFSPAEHTDSMKRRKERKRRERLEKLTTNKSKISIDSTTNSNSSTTATVVRGNSTSSRSVSELPIVETVKNVNNINQPALRSKEIEDEFKYDTSSVENAPTTQTSRGEHRGSTRVIIHETIRGQQQDQQQKRSFLASNDSESTASSKNGYNYYMRPSCPVDDDDMFYSKWCSFCFIDGNNGDTSTTTRRSFSL